MNLQESVEEGLITAEEAADLRGPFINALRQRFIAYRLDKARKDAETRQGVAQQAARALVAYWERQQEH